MEGSHDVGSVIGSVERAGCEWLQYDYGSAVMAADRPGAFTMWRYRDLLPLPDGPVRYPVPIGGTPLLPAPALVEDGLRRGLNTTTTASTGNAAVATAFGAAAAGMRAVLFVSADCLLITGHEVKASRTPVRARVAVAEGLDEVERASTPAL